jgi:DNA primase
MNIYQLVFGVDSGQVNCAFHDDSRPSAGIGHEGQYHCLTCGAKAHNEIGFISKYFGVSQRYAATIQSSLIKAEEYKYNKNPISDEQNNYLKGIGLSDAIIKDNFFMASTGKLMYEHKWNGVRIGTTWFNNPGLSNHNATAAKYKYGPGVFSGMLTPYDVVQANNTIIICEGEKDMLTARSQGITNAVAKLGGAKSYIIGGKNLENKNVVLVYDCDEAGRAGAKQDAQILTERFKCKVKVIDLGLGDAEDLNDFFVKHKKTPQDLYNLFKTTPIYIADIETAQSKLHKLVSKLTPDEIDQLVVIMKEKQGEKQ